MTSRLTGVRGPLTGRTFDLTDYPLTIGRAADNHIAIASPRASRHHAQIRREGAVFVLYDLGSGNGTLVNGQRVQRAVLQPGDLIDIGDEVFRFEAAHQQDATVLGAPAVSPPYPPVSYPPASAPPPAQPGTPYPAQPGTAPAAYPPPQPAYPPQAAHPPQQPAYPQQAAYPSPQPAYPPQAAHPPQQPAAYPPQMPPASHAPASAPGYAPPPPRSKSGGRSCLLMVALLLTLVCVAGAAGAFVFRDRLREIINGGSITPTIARPPVQTGSATVGSGQAAAIAMPNGGPMIEVPPGAVPANPDGSPGTLTFSVAPAPEQPISLPRDMALSGQLYQFEPEGVTFAVPVRITLPIPAGTDPARVMGLITRDPQRGAWVPVTGVVDAAARTVSAEVTHFSPYGVYSYTGSDPDAWNRANGGWFIIENRSIQSGTPYPGCRSLPRALYVNVCIQQANLNDPSLASMLPGDNLLALGPRSSYGTPYQPLKAWLPAGTYTVVHYVFMVETNAGDPMYTPCSGWWVKPPQVINLRAGQSVTFEPFSEADGTYTTSFDTNTCTGTPASGAPVLDQPPQQPPQQPGQPVETHGVCPAKMNGDWDAAATLRETNDPDLQDEIGDVSEAAFAFQINGQDALVQYIENGQRSESIKGTCTVQDSRYVLTLKNEYDNTAIVFRLQFNGDNRMTGEVTILDGEKYATGDVNMNRR